jgi:putative salt-induced outer membrane protein YdiY
MRSSVRYLPLVLVLLLAGRARGQTHTGPALLAPPPLPALDVDAYSAPWSPPAEMGVSTQLAEETLPSPSATDAEALPKIVRVEEPAWHQPGYWVSPDYWETSVELGLNGSAGTRDSFSFRVGSNMQRESRYAKLKLTTAHNRTTTGGSATQNNAQVDLRNDWLLDETSPWTLYGTGNLFYDEFQAFDLQVSGHSGIGYRFIRDPQIDLIGRVGGGTSREIGGPDDRWVPESLLGFEFNQKLTPAQKFYAKLDYYPEWEQVGEFRLVADAGWQIELAQPSNMSLKISASDRYDSTPNGAHPHLVNYSVLLMMKL